MNISDKPQSIATSAADATAQAWTADRYQTAVAASIVALTAIRLYWAAKLPLAFDEALYWRWSQHLSLGYLDHPPMNPLMIRLGTELFGQTEFGVRVIGVLLGLPASWAVWKAAAVLFKDPRLGATAALYFNLTLAMAAGSVLATPDSPVMVTTCFLLLSLAKLAESERGEWWLAVGVAFGLGMFSKYSTLFFAFSILIWVVVVPDLRRWLVSPWPWFGAALALVIFSPVLLWNAEHQWASVRYQGARLVVHEWSLRYLGEFFVTQLGLATPPVFILGCMGLVGLLRFRAGAFVSRALIGAMVWPIVAYFAWHSFHGRVEGNWPEPLYPAFVIAAAVAADLHPWRGTALWWAAWSKRLAVPVGLAIGAFVYAQALFGVIPAGRADPTARVLGAGWPELATRIDEVRKNAGAGLVLTSNYGLASWLAFYLPSHPPVEQTNGRMRWVDAPQPGAALFGRPMLFVCGMPCSAEARLDGAFDSVVRLAVFERERHGVTIDSYALYRLAGPRGPVLEQP